MAHIKPVDDLELDPYDRMLAADMDYNRPLYADARPSDEGPIWLGLFFLLIVGSFAFLCFACYEGGTAVWHAYLLSSRGEPANARITAYTRKTMRVPSGGRGRPGRDVTFHVHVVKFDGHVGSVILNKEMPVGTEISVLYLPESPEVVTAGKAGEPFGALLFRQKVDPNVWMMLITLICGLVWFVVQGILDIVWRLSGRHAPRVPTAWMDHLPDWLWLGLNHEYH